MGSVVFMHLCLSRLLKASLALVQQQLMARARELLALRPERLRDGGLIASAKVALLSTFDVPDALMRLESELERTRS